MTAQILTHSSFKGYDVMTPEAYERLLRQWEQQFSRMKAIALDAQHDNRALLDIIDLRDNELLKERGQRIALEMTVEDLRRKMNMPLKARRRLTTRIKAFFTPRKGFL